MRKIHIEVTPGIDSEERTCYERQRSRLGYFVEILKGHADDPSQKPLLRELKIDFSLSAKFPQRNLEKYMFGLESLASLHSIKDVQFTGLSEWYAKCMQLSIEGKGGEVQETDWPLVQMTCYRSIKNSWSKKKTKQWKSTRKWYQPTLDWKEYAVRNNIPIPDDIDKFWVTEE
jgi:hypothetical protein